MRLLVALSPFFALALAAVVPRQGTIVDRIACRFTLTSVGVINGTVKKDTIGEVILGGAFAEGVFYLDPSTHQLTDGSHKGCYFSDSDGQFQCFQPGMIAGSTDFGFTYTPQLDDDGVYLTYDQGVWDYLACPAALPSTGEIYELYRKDKADPTGCKAVTLLRQNEEAFQPGVCDVIDDADGSCGAQRRRRSV